MLYMDGMIITNDDIVGIHTLPYFLNQNFETKDLDQLHHFIGHEITSSSDGYYLSQAKYAFNLLSKAGLSDSNH